MTTPNQSEISIRLNGQVIGVAKVSARIDEAGRLILTSTEPDPAEEIARLRAEIATLKVERDDCPTCAGDGVIFGTTTKAEGEGEDWVERVDSESIDPCPECEGTKRSLVTRQKAEIVALKEAGRLALSHPNCTCRVTPCGVCVRSAVALRALCVEEREGAATSAIPAPAAPAEMPEPFVVRGEMMATCHRETREVTTLTLTITPEESAALVEWLTRVRAWQEGGR